MGLRIVSPAKSHGRRHGAFFIYGIQKKKGGR